jgi:hypothetical protein
LCDGIAQKDDIDVFLFAALRLCASVGFKVALPCSGELRVKTHPQLMVGLWREPAVVIILESFAHVPHRLWASLTYFIKPNLCPSPSAMSVTREK